MAMFELPALVTGLPDPPPAALDPFLDAAAECFARFGIQRTSVQDVAQLMRVNRTTVYRQVGNVESMVRLLAARDLHRVLSDLPNHFGADDGPDALIALLAAIIEFARAHPVVAKVLADEPQLIGLLLEDYPEAMARLADAVTPLLRAAMESGRLARRDPGVLAEWIARVGVTMILAPPAGSADEFLREILLPVLEPGRRPNK
jgi:AcrR family transcriptional regulator